MNILKLLVVLTSSAFFTACGGSGESDGGSTGGGSGGGGSDGGTGGGNINVNLTANIVQSTVCNTKIAATNAELVVYDNNWVIKSRHKPDAQGKINASIPQTQSVNIAFITQTTTTTGTQTYVESKAQHPVGDLGQLSVAYNVPGDCECRTKEIAVNSLTSFDDSDVQLTGAFRYSQFTKVSPTTGVFSDVQICRSPNASWPALTVFGHNGIESVAGFLRDYDINANLDVNLNTSGQPYTAVVDSNFSSVSLMHEVDGTFAEYPISTGTNNISVLNTLETLSRVNLTANHFEQSVEDNQTVNILMVRRKAFDYENENTATLTMPDARPLISLAETFDTFINSDSTSYQINNAEQYTVFSVYANVRLADGSTYIELFDGPTQGNYPENLLPDDYGLANQLDGASNINIDLSLFRYSNQNVYQTAIQKLSQRSRLSQKEFYGEDWADFSYISISANLELE